ncbi:MAG: hypothetical protein A3I71_01015 [Omnitrophica WOR_2 bacterium RIFCSPLOWO2_02_FULL_63_16]|nr:MAG: hypothetical protein A2Z92_06525 [Omnitrophica WOR_2 bacterium GWA2_63_20]OGX31192.1 MAG: hypothetical protein A3E56_03955 [Omnitrophica WOR_2 bacterium RIFCSPHIGHO2_12_FULL_64_13]OGX35913.1 MAG: hypothetical protein A3B73_05655 [Omnitrophica WOR_2 bacterium RIFCSPHIGHO2_02_FULL_63_39]OGX45358.1 MAG: hypothetical protein A3I71_01015 [Omnitrophica WOR_2 bacterium RIFCSPLOWO2_02_FULL_63_16]HBQ37725.1 hypothetical protein [Candidatus Omnitrophota bacterium]
MFGRHHERPLSVSRDDEGSEARFRRFLQDLHTYERHMTFETTRDAFLDLYSAWLKTREPWLKIQLVMLAFELHRLNPEFQFDLNFAD